MVPLTECHAPTFWGIRVEDVEHCLAFLVGVDETEPDIRSVGVEVFLYFLHRLSYLERGEGGREGEWEGGREGGRAANSSITA